MDPRTAVGTGQIRPPASGAETALTQEMTMMFGACPVDPEFLGAFEQQTVSDDFGLDEALGARCASL